MDSAREDDDSTPFRNIMNEFYCRDTSQKIRSTFQAKGKSGKHQTRTVIYGYLWNETRDQWIVDKEAAEVVKCIYQMTIDGLGPYQIAKKLSEEQVRIPSAHLAQHDRGEFIQVVQEAQDNQQTADTRKKVIRAEDIVRGRLHQTYLKKYHLIFYNFI